VEAELVEYESAYAGTEGATLHAVSAGTGENLAEYALKAPPVFDGLIAARGRLYMALEDGRVVCMSGS
jgi:hypothetical protein